ncbi:MAG: hypothetical protein K6U80_04650 [Firmicutes bacterium]|nr:hypothetical protein [Bacillota bacterium]
MQNYLEKKIFVFVCVILLELIWATAARADTEFNSFVYTGFLHFPAEIGGFTSYTNDCFASGSTFSLIAGYFGIDVDLMTGIAWDDWNDEFDTTLPLLWSGNLIFYPFSQAFITPYIKIGYGGVYTWLQLENNLLSGLYTFSRNDMGCGISFRGDSYRNYFFIEFLCSTVHGRGAIASFFLRIYKAGYVVVY